MNRKKIIRIITVALAVAALLAAGGYALWKNGFFQHGQTEMALAALESMNFDGKERLMENLKKLKGATEYGLSDNTGRPAETGIEESGE